MSRARHLPQVWLLLYGAAGLAAGRLLHLPAPAWLRLGGTILCAAGLALMIWAAWTMTRARTTVMPGRQPSALVTRGPFAFSRNPIYLGDLLILGGALVAADALSGLVFVPLFAATLTRRFIRDEEERLRAGFGGQFAAWSARVRRWV